MVGVGARVDQLQRLYEAYREAVARGDVGQAQELRTRAEGVLWELGKVPHFDVATLAAQAPWRRSESARAPRTQRPTAGAVPSPSRSSAAVPAGANGTGERAASPVGPTVAVGEGQWVTVQVPRWSRVEFVRRLRARLVGQRVQLDVEWAQRR